MRYNKNSFCWMFSLNEVKKILARQYDGIDNGPSIQRELHIHRSDCNNGKAGCLFFGLKGSPPKGYAIYIPDHSYLLLVDAWGKTKLRKDCKLVDDKDKFVDINKMDGLTILKEVD